MGYEVRFYAVREMGIEDPDTGMQYSQIISMLDMCKMGWSGTLSKFYALFDKETFFSLTVPDPYPEYKTDRSVMQDVTEDEYGNRLMYCSDKAEAVKLAEELQEQDAYWRYGLLVQFLKAFKDNDAVYIVLYGY